MSTCKIIPAVVYFYKHQPPFGEKDVFPEVGYVSLIIKFEIFLAEFREIYKNLGAKYLKDKRTWILCSNL